MVDLDPFHNPALLIVLVFAYTKGYLRFPESSPAGENPEVSEFRKSLPAIEAVVASLAPYISIHYGLAVPLRPWLHVSLLAGIAAIGYFAPTAKFYGPFRFGYLQCSDQISRFYKLLDWWCCVALFLFPYLTSFHPDIFYLMVLPILSLSLMAMLVAAQAKVRECDNARKQDISARAIAEKYAKAASDAVVSIDINLKVSLDESLAVVAAAERARIFADQAITSATYGEMATAIETAASVRTEASAAELSAERSRRAMDTSRAILLGWLQGK